jgi:hypothetical protein
VNAPFPLLVGGISLKGAFPNSFSGTEKLVITGVSLVITKGAVIIADVLFAVLA